MVVSRLAQLAPREPPPATLLVRPYRDATDRPFVLDSWVKSYANSTFARRMGHRYLAAQEAVARWCLGDARTLVAHHDEDEATVLGWCCGGPGVVHYVYVGHRARRLNVATILLAHQLGQAPEAEVRVTHKPPPYLTAKVPRGWSLRPLTAEEMRS